MATTVETAPTLDETAVQGLAAAMRGNLVQPGDPSYDEARTVYNAMIDKHPALIARCATVADVIAAVNFARDNDLLVAIRGGGHNGPGLGTCDDGLVIDLSRDERRPRRSRRPHRPRRGRRAPGRGAPRHARLRPGDSQRHHLHHRRRRHHPGRRARPPHPPNAVWPSTICSRPTWCWPTAASSPPARRSTPTCSGRCAAAAATSASSPRSCSGCTRSAPSTPGRCSGRWSRSAEVLRWYREFITDAPGRSQRLLRLPDRAAGAALPGGALEPEDVRRGLVLHRRHDRGGASSRRSAPSSARRRSTGSARSRTRRSEHVRRALSGGRAVVLEGRLRQRADRRGDRPARRVRPSSCRPGKSTMHLYPINGAAGRVPKDATAWSYRDAKWGKVIVGVSPDPADNERDDRAGRATTGRRCTPTRRAAPTST